MPDAHHRCDGLANAGRSGSSIVSLRLLTLGAAPGCRHASGLAIVLLLLLSACSSLPREDFTKEEQSSAVVQGAPAVRVWGDASFAEFNQSSMRPPRRSLSDQQPLHYLALSGGGSGGAFGAGLLTGWTADGTRPKFNLVSGVSTGALIAPFAFLGPTYDPVIKSLYTSGIAETLARRKGLIGVLTSNALADPRPLRRLIEEHIDFELLQAVAREHRNDRRLLVVTTNLDAQRAVVWDMGAIAASGRPEALRLFQDVLMASASIPVVFPPVLIEVESSGKHFSEMHADGGTTTQVFTLPDAFLASAAEIDLPDAADVNLYVVINNVLMPEFEVVDNATLSVAERAYSTLIKTHIRGSLYATQALARRSGIAFHVAAIDQNVVAYDASDPFDTDYMRALFDLGYRRAVEGKLWSRSPFKSEILQSSRGLASARTDMTRRGNQ